MSSWRAGLSKLSGFLQGWFCILVGERGLLSALVVALQLADAIGSLALCDLAPQARDTHTHIHICIYIYVCITREAKTPNPKPLNLVPYSPRILNLVVSGSRAQRLKHSGHCKYYSWKPESAQNLLADFAVYGP